MLNPAKAVADAQIVDGRGNGASAGIIERASWIEQLEVRSRFAPDDAAREAERWLDEGSHRDDDVQLRRVLLVQARAAAQGGRSSDGVQTMREITAWAADHHERYLQARGERLISDIFRRVGESSAALEHAVAGLDLLDPDVHPAVRADHVLGLADALATCGSFDDAERRYDEAQSLAMDVEDPRLRALILNNRAYTLYEAGRLDDAVSCAERMLAVSQANGLSLELFALDTIARTYITVGRLEDAERVLRPISDAALGVGVSAAPEPDVFTRALLTLVETQRLRGNREGAQLSLDVCSRICDEHGLTATAVEALREQALLHADARRFEDAFHVYQRFHERQLSLNAEERETRARMIQAIFETTEARRDTERFRELSYRDALTRLRNRRYVDEHLVPLLDSCAEALQPLTVAFLDLDRFKQVNDTCSHAVGDEVLRQVGGLLEACASSVDGAFCARMGGEEFLLVLPGLGRDSAAIVLEQLRVRVGGHDWAALTGELPVTVSIGAATAPLDGTDRRHLLACADFQLYAAKRAGRNRVVQTSP